MPRIATPLNVLQINSAKPKEKLYKLTDGGGLALWIYPTGRKVWRLEYSQADKKRNTLTFGDYPQLTLLEARALRDEKKALLNKGQSIQAEEKQTLNQVYEDYYLRWAPTVSEGYALQVYRAIQANVMPTLGHLDITLIKPRQIVEALTPMETRGSLEYLRRTKQSLGLVFDFAVARGLCEYNPVASVKNSAFKKHTPKHFAALKSKQLAYFLYTLNESETQLITKNCILFILLTLARPSEATNARWDEIDFNENIWYISIERMKKKREHIVPLSTAALQLLKHMKAISGSSEYVFPSASFKKPINRETPRIALRRFRDKGIDTTTHGLRALVRTTLEETKQFRRNAMERALSHVEKDKTEAAYNRAEYLEERKEMLEWWGNEIQKNIEELGHTL